VILTKMMRIDPQDFADIRFLLQQERLDSAALQEAFQSANVPDIPYLHRPDPNRLTGFYEPSPADLDPGHPPHKR
jgi:hypothetical protein